MENTYILFDEGDVEIKNKIKKMF